MTIREAIQIARQKADFYKSGYGYECRAYSAKHRAWWVSNAGTYEEARERTSINRITEALIALGWDEDEASYEAQGYGYGDYRTGDWTDVVRRANRNYGGTAQ